MFTLSIPLYKACLLYTSIIDNATVEVTDGIITYVGPKRGEERDGYYQHYWHYNARGKCLLPGFVDSQDVYKRQV